MKHAAFVICLLVFGSLTLPAQKPTYGPSGSATISDQDGSLPSANILLYPLNSSGGACPIGMHARQGVWDHSITVKRGEERYKGPFGQRIVLTLTEVHPKKIVAATVLVRGFNGKNRMMQTGITDGNATKILRTGFTATGDNSVAADLYISGFTAVTSVKLLDATYSDGSTWHSDQLNPCRVAPDPLMLVAEH